MKIFFRRKRIAVLPRNSFVFIETWIFFKLFDFFWPESIGNVTQFRPLHRRPIALHCEPSVATDFLHFVPYFRFLMKNVHSLTFPHTNSLNAFSRSKSKCRETRRSLWNVTIRSLKHPLHEVLKESCLIHSSTFIFVSSINSWRRTIFNILKNMFNVVRWYGAISSNGSTVVAFTQLCHC